VEDRRDRRNFYEESILPADFCFAHRPAIRATTSVVTKQEKFKNAGRVEEFIRLGSESGQG